MTGQINQLTDTTQSDLEALISLNVSELNKKGNQYLFIKKLSKDIREQFELAYIKTKK